MRAWLAENYIIIGCLLILLIGVLAIGLAPPVAAAPVDVEACVPMATAEGQTLHFCEGNVGPDCVWDPAPALGAGVLTCEW